MPILSENQARSFASNAGFQGSALDVIVAIAHAESSLNTHPPDNVNTDHTRDRGILQINDTYHAEVSDTCAYDPACAFKAGYVISIHGTDFSPWTTYNNGAYKTYMPRGGGGSSSGGAETVRQSMVPGYDWFAPYLGPGTRQQGGHEGEDLGKASGSKAYFPESGSIYFPGHSPDLGHTDPLGGNIVYLKGDSGLRWYFAHLASQHTFEDEQKVRKGQVLGIIDNSGDAETTKAHLHYQVGPGGNWGDPAVILKNGIGGSVTDNSGSSGSGGYVTLYDELNYTGNTVIIRGDTMNLADVPKGSNGDPNWNNRAKSIRIPSGTVVRLYENVNYASGTTQGGVKIDASSSIPDLPSLFPFGLSSIRYEKLGSGGFGGGGINIGSVGDLLASLFPGLGGRSSLEILVNDAISTIPGFEGIVTAIDEAEELPGWIDHGTDDLAGIIRSVSDTVFSNGFGIMSRFLIFIVGFIIFIGLMMNLTKALTGVSAADVVRVAAVA